MGSSDLFIMISKKNDEVSTNSNNLQAGYAVSGNVEVRQRSTGSCNPDVLCFLSHVVS